jgi:hypothetical protein
MLSSREFHRWESQATARTPSYAWLWTGALAAALAGWVYHGIDHGDPTTRWLVFAIAGFALAFLRAPTHFFWRSDATLLARLPIAGQVLFDSGLRRSLRDASRYALVLACGAAPLLATNARATLPYLAIGAALVLMAAGAGPASCVGAGTLVTQERARQLLAGSAPATAPTAVLGGLPGFVAAIAIVLVIGCAGSLDGGSAELPWPIVAAALASVGVGSAIVARQLWAVHMPAMLRDVTTLDRQQLATLQILPAAPLHRLLARAMSPAAARLLDVRSRLMSRRYPMASVAGALAFVILVAVAIWPRPDLSMFVTTVVSAAVYAVLLARRLGQEPTAVPRLERALGITAAVQHSAHTAWIQTWWWLFVGLPGGLAAARADQPALAAVTLVAATMLSIITPRLRSPAA